MSPEGYNCYPDTVLHNGRILTCENPFSAAQALAIKNGRLIAVGQDGEILSLHGTPTRVIDLQGRTVIPGLIDTHAHMDREGLRRAYPSLQHCRTIADVQQLIRDEVGRHKAGEWIVTLPLGRPPFHLDQQRALVEGRYPSRHDLDQASPDNPVWIRSSLSYWNYSPPFVHVLNSAALRACGITDDTRPPCSSVEIERDPDTGEVTGRILEWQVEPVAEVTLLQAAPRFTREVRVQGLRRAIALSLAAGTTGVYEGHGVAAELHSVYKELHDAGELAARTRIAISPPPFGSMSEAERMLGDWAHYACGPGFGDEWLKVCGIFLNYGGNPETERLNHAAWPYTGWPGFVDHYNSPEEYRELCRLAAKQRLRVCTYIGKAIDEVLTIWSEIDREYPIRGLRWMLVHGKQMEPERDYPRIKRLGLVITTQPSSYIYRSGLSAVQEGANENKLLAHRDYLETGIPWSLSTDNKPYQMMFTLWAAVARRERLENRVIGPLQRVTVPQALQVATRGGAYACFEEHERGSLAAGKLADLVVVSEDPLNVPEDVLKEIQVELTMVGGRVVHSSNQDIAQVD